MAKSKGSASVPTLGQEIGKKRPFESPEVEAFLNIVRTASVLTCQTLRFFKGFGLSESQYNALRILRGHGEGGIASQTIGEQLVAQVPDVTRLVDRLVKRGLAERSRTEQDRRVVTVRITREGLELLGRIDRPLVELHKRQLGHLSREDLKAISELMVRARACGTDGGGAETDGDVRGRCP